LTISWLLTVTKLITSISLVLCRLYLP
jgi:hypothetical protein